jgi:hypothetical protein
MSKLHLACADDGACVAASRTVRDDEKESVCAAPNSGRPWLSAKDFALLDEYLERYAERDAFVARLIRTKLDEAVVVFSDSIDPARNAEQPYSVSGRRTCGRDTHTGAMGS